MKNLQFIEALLLHSKNLSKDLRASIDNHNYNTAAIIAYNVYEYAWNAWELYIKKYACANAHTLLLGINPGPHGMVQTGIPFGNIETVTQWLKLNPQISQPRHLHPKRPVSGLNYHKNEASGRLLWQTIREIYPNPQDFFSRYFVLNYCPIAFFEADGKNITPDRLPKPFRAHIEALCTAHLCRYLELFNISNILCVGRYSTKVTENLLKAMIANFPDKKLFSRIHIHYITHPSPLNPKHREFPKEFCGYDTTLH